MEIPKLQGYLIRSEEKKHIANKFYADWLNVVRTKGPKQQKPIEYDGQVFQSKKQFRDKMKIPESQLNKALKRGELNGIPIKHITKEEYKKRGL
jgi:hypothetical protein